ncbi:GPI-anchored surface protein, putative, partial [Bodo saltans]
MLTVLVLVFVCHVLTVRGNCTSYCNAGDALTGTSCRSTIDADGHCSGVFTEQNGHCITPLCSGIISTQYANVGDCCTTYLGPTITNGGDLYSCLYPNPNVGLFCFASTSSRGCYRTASPPSCPGGSTNSGGTCKRAYMSYSCPSNYTLSGTSCFMDYDAFTISTQADCTTAAPATDGCQWCSSISICLPAASTCPATCPDAGQSICTITPSSTCQWCTSTTSIGVCQLRTLGCFATCLGATTNFDVCDARSECKYCNTAASIGVCQPNSGTCWATCTPASDDPLGKGVCTASADCKWCPTLGYCTERQRNCHTLCTTVAPEEPAICQVQSIQAQCLWCGAPGSVEYCVARTDDPRLRCAASCGGLIWRPDVCNGALECHWCGVHNAAQGGRCKPLPGKSRGYVAWRREVECDTQSESHSSSFSRSASVTSSQTRSGDGSASDTSTATGSRSMSATNSLSTTASSASQSGGTESLTLTLSGSATSASMSVSYHLPPCNASHLETLAYVWPQLFNFTTNYSAVRQVGFPSILLTGDVRDPGLI